jgi:hypothetical protein
MKIKFKKITLLFLIVLLQKQSLLFSGFVGINSRQRCYVEVGFDSEPGGLLDVVSIPVYPRKLVSLRVKGYDNVSFSDVTSVIVPTLNKVLQRSIIGKNLIFIRFHKGREEIDCCRIYSCFKGSSIRILYDENIICRDLEIEDGFILPYESEIVFSFLNGNYGFESAR